MPRPARRRSAMLVVVALASMASGDVEAAVGGPDAFGYSFTDQAEGVPYVYIDITTTGTLAASGDTEIATIPLSAPFEMYGMPLVEVVVNTNGFLTDDPGSANDISNDCPIPDAPSTGGGFRVYALHDDLLADVYTEYLDQAAAAAAGYPGEAAGISVFQWVGTHDGGGGVIDAEAILFHDDFSIVTMVAADAETGSNSTLGIQDTTASVGLTYTCDAAMSVLPGVTAVRYDLGPPPDSDCCSPSPTNTPGCTNGPCQSVVCDLDPSCCTSAWSDLCGEAALNQCQILCGSPPPVTINEIRVDQDGPDDDEYIELMGPPGTSLFDIQYIVLGDQPTGELETVLDLSGQVIPASGRLVVAEGTFTVGSADLTTSINFENADTVTHMLVGGLSAAQSDNLDVDGDGLLDVTPWIAVLDTVSLIDPGSTDLPYGPGSSCVVGPTCQEVSDGIEAPHQIFRCPDGDGTWLIGNPDELGTPDTDTPGDVNACPDCGNGMLEVTEECDDAGETALCDPDCSLAVCGDGQVNASAGELCDDAGESLVCDDDCTPPECGDGVTNTAAGEECDDAGESDTCDDDCSVAVCGDGLLNSAAGEECDDAGESPTCDDDCTTAMCGDTTVNTTAGETCDDGGRTPRCNADCTGTSCGDGVLNRAAGEECDDAGESATCDDDCTTAMCGDGATNTTAGEACDDAGESDACDDDCSLAQCGDGQLNATAGEACDDGNVEDGDDCASDCTAPTGTDSTEAGDSTEASDATGSEPASTSMTGDSTGDPGATPVNEGCGCVAAPRRGGALPWALLALLALGTRRRAPGVADDRR